MNSPKPRLPHIHRHIHSQTDQPLGEKGDIVCAQRPHSPVTSLLFRTSSEKMSGTPFPVQLASSSRSCAWIGGCVGGRLQLPLNSTPCYCHTIYTDTLTSFWKISGLCLVSECPQPETLGASHLVGIWSSPSTDAPSLQMRRKTRPEENTLSSSSAMVSNIFFAISLLHHPSPFLLLFLLSRSILLIGSLSHWYIDCGH